MKWNCCQNFAIKTKDKKNKKNFFICLFENKTKQNKKINKLNKTMKSSQLIQILLVLIVISFCEFDQVSSIENLDLKLFKNVLSSNYQTIYKRLVGNKNKLFILKLLIRN